MVQGADGYLWITSGTGLYRFDGVRFTKFIPQTDSKFLSSSMECILAVPDGGLWVSYQFGGASFIKNGTIVSSNLDNTGHGSIQGFALDFDGTVWASTGFSLLRREGNVWKGIGSDWNYTAKSASPPTVDGDGNLWVSDGEMLYVLMRGSKRFEATGIRGGGLADHFDKGGKNWVLGGRIFSELSRSTSGVWQEHTTSLRNVSSAMITSKGNLVFARNNTISQADPSFVLPAIPRSEDELHTVPLSMDKKPLTLLGLLEDREGSIWVLTSKGLDQFRTTVLTTVELNSGTGLNVITADRSGSLLVGALHATDEMNEIAGTVVSRLEESPSDVASLYTAADGTVWVGGVGKLWKYRDHHFTSVPLPAMERTVTSEIQALTMDRAGTLWASILAPSGPLVFQLKDGKWSPYVETQTGRQPFPLSLHTDRDGNVWLGYSRNRITIVSPDGKRRLLRETDGLKVGTVITIYEYKGRIWIGGTAGLDYFTQDRLHHLVRETGAPFEGVAGIIERDNGDLWLSMTDGVMKIAASEMQAAAVSQADRVTGNLFTSLDGVQGAPSLVRPVPTAAETGDGKIYFTSKDMLAWVNPNSLNRNDVMPLSTIDSALVDGKRLSIDGTVKLEKGAQNLQIDYSANSLFIPQRVRFRYRLEGFDKDWLDAGNRRQAYYSHLPPGSYTFHVIACNNEGIWGYEASPLVFVLPPTFLQSWPFKLICLGLAITTLWLLYLARLQIALASARGKIYERLSERERIARDLHDTFFQGIQGLLLRFNTGLAQLSPEEPARSIFVAALEQSDQVMMEGRELVLDLRATTETADLATIFARAGEELRLMHTAEFKISVFGKARLLHPLAAGDIYRLGREALYNAFRHGDAKQIELELHYVTDRLILRVRDDGKGIEQKILRDQQREGHWGLPGMYERAEKVGAHLELWSRPGSGTEIELSVPGKAAYVEESPAMLPSWLSRWGGRPRSFPGD